MCLNHKCWEWYYKDNEERAQLYKKLYEKTYDAVLDHYADDESALDYIYSTLD